MPPLLVLSCFVFYSPGVSSEDVPLTKTYRTCREDNVTFTWSTNVTTYHFIDLIFVPHDQVTSNSTNARSVIMSITPSPERVRIDNRYIGRLSHSIRNGVYSFKLVSVSPKDRGFYQLLVSARESFQAKSDLIIYAGQWPNSKISLSVGYRSEVMHHAGSVFLVYMAPSCKYFVCFY